MHVKGSEARSKPSGHRRGGLGGSVTGVFGGFGARGLGVEDGQGAGGAFEPLRMRVEVEVFGAGDEAFGHDELGFDPHPRELLCGHSVPAHESGGGKRGRAEDADPGELFDAEVRVEGEVERDGGDACGSRKAALAKRHAEEHRLAEVANLAVDFDFQGEASCSVAG